MGVAITSLMTGRPVKHNVAMTGEITLQGRILRIGGVKEKILAAARAGIKTVIAPKENEGDLQDLPEEGRKRVELVLVETLDEAVNAALRKQSVYPNGRSS